MSVKETVIAITAKYAHPSRMGVVNGDELLSDLHLNPLDRAYSLPLEIEERLGVELSGEEIEGWETVEDVVRCVAGKMREAAA